MVKIIIFVVILVVVVAHPAQDQTTSDPRHRLGAIPFPVVRDDPENTSDVKTALPKCENDDDGHCKRHCVAIGLVYVRGGCKGEVCRCEEGGAVYEGVRFGRKGHIAGWSGDQ